MIFVYMYPGHDVYPCIHGLGCVSKPPWARMYIQASMDQDVYPCIHGLGCISKPQGQVVYLFCILRLGCVSVYSGYGRDPCIQIKGCISEYLNLIRISSIGCVSMYPCIQIKGCISESDPNIQDRLCINVLYRLCIKYPCIQIKGCISESDPYIQDRLCIHVQVVYQCIHVSRLKDVYLNI